MKQLFMDAAICFSASARHEKELIFLIKRHKLLESKMQAFQTVYTYLYINILKQINRNHIV